MRVNAPAPAITGDVCRCSVNWKGASGFYVNGFDYMADALAVVTAPILLDLATAFATECASSLEACVSEDVTLQSVYAAGLSLNTAATQSYVVNAAGSVAQHQLPSEMGITILKQSYLKGQHGRGRVTLPGCPSTFVTAATSPDTLNATADTPIEALLVTLIATLTAGGHNFVPVLATRPTPPSHLVTLAQPIHNFTWNPILGTARRRKVGRGT